MNLTCADMEAAGFGFDSSCCTSCHEDADEGYATLSEEHPPDKQGLLRGDSAVMLHLCCARYSDACVLTDRSNWAKLIRAARKRRRA